MLGRDCHDNGGWWDWWLLPVAGSAILIVLCSGCGAEKMRTTSYKLVEPLVCIIMPSV